MTVRVLLRRQTASIVTSVKAVNVSRFSLARPPARSGYRTTITPRTFGER